MNFVVKLLESIRFNIVIIVVDLVSKKIYFIPAHTMIIIKSITRFFLYDI